MLIASLSLMSCIDSSKNASTQPTSMKPKEEQPILETDVRSVVDRDFHKYYTGCFDKQDSCFFRTEINYEYDTTEVVPYFSFNNCIIHHGSCDQIKFDFSVLTKRDSEDLYFYGHYDTYELVFSDASYQGKIIPFNNIALNEILNQFIQLKRPPGEYERFTLLETFLTNIYFTNYYSFINVKTPFFEDTLPPGQFRSRYRNKENAVLFDQLFDKDNTNRMLIFENKFFGAVVFKYHFAENNSLKIEEFVMPRIDRVKQFLTDGLPDYLSPCLTDEYVN